MSDIYLQITETPTVVTLSAPVVSGALASTVTVANTVTVALDSNSLSALENVTVTVGAAVSISNFPASQAVTFSAVTISNFPATQTIAGTVTAMAGTNFSDEIYQGILEYANGEGGDGSVPLQVNIGTLPAISGTVTANVAGNLNGAIEIVEDSGNASHKVAVQIYAANGVPLGDTSLPISGTVTVGNSVTIASLPAISGTVTANAGTGTFVISDKGTTGEGTATSFTSTSSAVLKASNSNRKLLTIFNEGSGTIFILLGSGTASTTNYSLRLLSGDYYELEKYTGEVNAIFGAAGTAKITEIT